MRHWPDHRQKAPFGVAFYAPTDLVTIHVGHLDVEEDPVRRIVCDHICGGRPVSGHLHPAVDVNQVGRHPLPFASPSSTTSTTGMVGRLVSLLVR
jgi:hypothetical protein